MVLSGLDPFPAEVLRQVIDFADPGSDDAARKRLFSTPSSGADPAFDAEWREYVQPGIEHLFQTARETVERDLRRMTEEDAEGLRESALRIPVAHFEAWLSTL